MLARSPNRRSDFRAVDTANRFEAADVALGLGLARAKDHPLVRTVGLASEIGSWKSLLSLSAGTLVLGLMVRDRRMAEAGRHMLQAGVLAGVVKTSLKRTVHRTRPNVLMEEGFYVRGWPGTGVGPWQSFPSGHSALSTAVACAAARAYPEIKGPAYAAAAGVVAAQVLRGAHFPADVLTGAVIGIAAEFTVDRLTRDRRRSPRWRR
ncbi:phosphatase PAP2 family protein (plasmid) [Methylobacterium sp. NMS14P]|uniref:phosphatase PAP2 family protein n=1 Tax=Methylobacterium sp. NMS14P TaxID=2894310 RepID=UPI002358DCFC|nr:phosphatase PAP2 family protein [Methylobacterium sp. NMS14P]WCS28537.1 phosphatase PAP2 family protein [Methylobacterium sp. NMS14P]